MGTETADLLSRYSLLQTQELAVAQRVTARFWPAHESEIVGPEAYDLAMNRVLLGQVAVTFVRCSARVRVVPLEPSQHASLIVPLDGSVEIETDRGSYRASPARPLFRGPTWLRRFEASPTRCLIVDIPPVPLKAALRSAGLPVTTPLEHVSISDGRAAVLRRRLLTLVKLANTSPRVKAIQSLGFRDRGRLLSAALRRREEAVLANVIEVIAGAKEAERQAISPREVATIEAWLAEHAFSGLSLADLAGRAGLSMRAIQRACQTNGYTPQEYLRGIRLDRAREMHCGPRSGLTVGDVATAVRYPHLGRFSQYYRERFGEMPSDTLARARAAARRADR